MVDLLLKNAVDERRSYLQHRLCDLGFKELTGYETLADLERMYISAMCEKENPKHSLDKYWCSDERKK
ncbi:hypothetical protein [Bacillus sp. JJ722]|uniref:hypothetical protein n=1 Tax=Bacillus sp. JJ722 TaxID=3122973 RepID=UPI003000F7E0